MPAQWGWRRGGGLRLTAVSSLELDGGASGSLSLPAYTRSHARPSGSNPRVSIGCYCGSQASYRSVYARDIVLIGPKSVRAEVRGDVTAEGTAHGNSKCAWPHAHGWTPTWRTARCSCRGLSAPLH
ncbi:hypothetical protein PF005_g8752 [Phytophthora fragariae]|uniref:Uncharacterized protein n=1 Tax=Phytophthora fragariae TaxID=53985 RepID=A0A6A3R291_9STRA|nr:hypothetical protein PF003_g39436 [Phytophthora fragariae]KAE8928629.1 hypothetical protein PF009_g21237 [Phytophthora fragariae]KAE8986622.1 hypothetical protein PF011_g19910 [Phytophthora fragariae]KAE9076864.1 hypothetical protein PF010_g23734 [Phytophthora fragariae]KAE9088165.1 hypothetical protein PF007_g20080 [Phytophthora fragariae]